MHRLFADALNAGKMDPLLALYEPGASLVPQPGQLVTGTEGIRQALGGFLGMKPTIALETRKIVQGGDIALLYGKWTLKGTGPDGKPVSMAGQSTEVVRRQPDGTWRYVVDNPYAVE
jgi:ketosteroid isomerase-like protein